MPNPNSVPTQFGYRDHRGVVHQVLVRETPDGAWRVLDVRVIDTLIGDGREAAEAIARDYVAEHHHPAGPTAGRRQEHGRAAA
jgi:hypothetical protein